MTAQTRPARPISSPAKAAAGRWFMVLFFGVFLALGSAFTYFLLVRPVSRVLAAKHWLQTRCTVISSRVQRHSSGDGTTYSVDILYAYEVNGKEYRSNRYNFMMGASSGYKSKAAVVRRHSPGTTTVCFVNPADPADAVLNRAFSGTMWFGLFPLVFVAVGGGGMLFALRKPKAGSALGGLTTGSRAQALRFARSATTTSLPLETSGPLVLKPAASRLAGTIFFGIFAAIWNGFVFFALLGSSGLFRRGRTDGFDLFPLLFMIPFVGVGLFLIVLVIYQILGLFNPKAEITVNPGTPALGQALAVAWRLTGRVHALQNLAILLEAREEATYRRGTTTHTDKKPFLTLDVTEAANPVDMRSGQKDVALPNGTMPSFKSPNNGIVWTIQVRGKIPWWPDLKEEFELHVRPTATAASQPA